MRFTRAPDPRNAKFAVRVLANKPNSEALCNEIVEVSCIVVRFYSNSKTTCQYTCESLRSADPDLLLAHVAAMTEMVRSCPDAFEQKSDVIVEFLLKNTLMASDDVSFHISLSVPQYNSCWDAV